MSMDYEVLVGFGFRMESVSPKTISEKLSISLPEDTDFDDVYSYLETIEEKFSEDFFLTIRFFPETNEFFVLARDPKPLLVNPKFDSGLRESLGSPSAANRKSLGEVAELLGYPGNVCELQVATIVS